MEKDRYNQFVQVLERKLKVEKGKKIIFLCVGSNKVIGDSFGPVVGSKLSEKLEKNGNIKIIGNMLKPIYKQNLKSTLNIVNKIENKYLILIDSAVSENEYVGNIFISDNSIEFGKSIGSGIKALGDINIKAGVCSNLYNSNKNFYQLKNVSKELINELSDIVSKGIYEILSN